MYVHPIVNFKYIPEGQSKNDKFIASTFEARVTGSFSVSNIFIF